MEDNPNDKTGNGENQKELTLEFYQSDVDHYLRTGELTKVRHTIAHCIVGMLHTAKAIEKWISNTELSEFTPGVAVMEQVVTAHAAELAIKHILDLKGRKYDKTHNLSELYDLFTDEEKNTVEAEYENYKKDYSAKRPPGWETAAEVFKTCANTSVAWRYNILEGKELDPVIPSLLRAAGTSVLSLFFPKDYLILNPESREIRQSLQEIRETIRRGLTEGFDG